MLKSIIAKSLIPNGKAQRFRLFEYSLYAVILLAALGIPFFTDIYSNYGWERVVKGWMRILPFVLIFAANNFIFVPKLLYREKHLYYILTCILSVIAVIFLSAVLFNLLRPEMPPFEGIRGMKPFPDQMPQPPLGKPFHFAPMKPFPHLFHFWMSIIAFLLIGFNAGVKSFVRWSEDKIRQAEKERQYYYTELAFLKHQISPHFFMNTLNNIHALVDINAEEAKNAIFKLSCLMRYLLYESNTQHVLLKKEIDFVESYIELMRLRYDEENLSIETKYPDNIENVYVPTALFLSFIENAFKHGVNPQDYSKIEIKFSVENEFLTFRIVNNRWDEKFYQTEGTGIGLENVRKRLDLIYKSNYTLDIQASGNIFDVILKIPVT
jgi:two-component sensor histidine kinase